MKLSYYVLRIVFLDIRVEDVSNLGVMRAHTLDAFSSPEGEVHSTEVGGRKEGWDKGQ
jgi:hypothetical protein